MTIWRRKKYTIICIIALIAYIMIVPKEYKVQFDSTIKGVGPAEVWEYVADFNNMKFLNPTILNFTITSDSGNYDHWEYGVYYTEHLSSFPFILNAAHGHYIVKKLDENVYVILSKHQTCFLGSNMCLASWSKFTFKEDLPNSRNTYCQETVAFECPRILSYVCHEEVLYQRKHIFSNLKKVLSVQSNHGNF
ncbi:uncharacterized protein isoform X2 [Rhodnius prolixus]|uniref:Uncharacterized protein n=3 Tax=Rhodnius TaxID=13248 RepID=T1HNB1_RHOPR